MEVQPAYTLTPLQCASPKDPPLGPEDVARLEQTLRMGTDDVNCVRLYAHYHVKMHFSSMVHRTITCKTYEDHNRCVARMAQVVRCFATETTFKVHGDAGLHAEITTRMLSQFMSSAMSAYETPYQLAVAAYPKIVNDVVRPLLDLSYRDRAPKLVWDGPYSEPDVIVAASLIVELVGVRNVFLVTNSTLCKRKSDTPLVFVRRKSDGRSDCGVRRGGEYRHFRDDATLGDILLTWLDDCENCGIKGLEDLRAAVFGHGLENNPMCKYLRSSAHTGISLA